MKSEILRKVFCFFAATAMLFGVNCAEDPAVDGDGDGDVDGKEDAWDRRNNPASWANDFEYNWEVLRQYEHGASEIVPWPDTYWPMTEDGYNDRWQGNNVMSPVELYDLAFNDWVPPEGYMELQRYRGHGMSFDAEYYEQMGPATRWAHEKGGNHRAREIHNPDGSFTDDIDADGDGVVDRDLNGDGEMDIGDDEGGLEGWFGHCHAWAPASFSQPEPQHEVTVNGVTFTIADVKALIESTYEGCGGTLFLGGRCNAREMTRDEDGRVIEDECRDTNAGAFHVVLTNVVGRLGRSFVADVTTDYQVWNHPVRDFTIHTQEEIDEAAAIALLGLQDVTEYPYNDEAERFVHVELTFRYVVEGSASAEPYIPRIDSFTRQKNYEYLLELDGDGNIIGGEWMSDNQPDFLWAPTRNCDATYGGYWSGEVVVSAANVQTLVDMATSSEEPPPPSDTEVGFDSECGLDIPDNDAAGVSDTITVDESLTIAGLRVNVNIPHTYIGDLIVTLQRDGEEVVLHDREGGSEDNLVESFNVDQFKGQDAAGDWTLHVSDNAGIDTGLIENWRLTVLTE